MGTVFKKHGNWYLDFRTSGRRVRKKIGKSKQLALLALKDAEVKAALNEYGFSKVEISIAKFISQFLDYSKANHSESTYNRYRAVLDNFKRFLVSKPKINNVSHITPKIIDLYKINRKNEWVNPNGVRVKTDKEIKSYTKKGAKAKTINFEIGVLGTALNLAKKWGYIKENPVQQIKKLKVNDSRKPRFLTQEECEKLLKHSTEFLYPIFFTFLNTGMRLAELVNLEWTDIDIKRRKIKIQRKDFWHPKTGEREIPINKKMLALLKKLQQKKKSAFVFTGKDGNKIKVKLREQLIKTAKNAEIENLTKIHALRHTFASHLVMKGVDLPTIQKLMGHSDIQTTMIYSHLAPDHLSDAVDKLDF